MNLRESSAGVWNSNSSIEHINAGSLQRIADATEKMARSYSELLMDVGRYKLWWKDEERRRQQAERRAAALAGHITRLRKKLA